jgi:hypothetical protein
LGITQQAKLLTKSLVKPAKSMKPDRVRSLATSIKQEYRFFSLASGHAVPIAVYFPLSFGLKSRRTTVLNSRSDKDLI